MNDFELLNLSLFATLAWWPWQEISKGDEEVFKKKKLVKTRLNFFFYFLQNNGHLSTQRARNNMVGISCWNSPMILCQSRNLVTCHLWILSRTDPIQTKPSFPFLQVYPLRTGLLALLNLPHLRFVFTPTLHTLIFKTNFS